MAWWSSRRTPDELPDRLRNVVQGVEHVLGQFDRGLVGELGVLGQCIGDEPDAPVVVRYVNGFYSHGDTPFSESIHRAPNGCDLHHEKTATARSRGLATRNRRATRRRRTQSTTSRQRYRWSAGWAVGCRERCGTYWTPTSCRAPVFERWAARPEVSTRTTWAVAAPVQHAPDSPHPSPGRSTEQIIRPKEMARR